MTKVFIGCVVETGKTGEDLQIGDEVPSRAWPHHISLAPPAEGLSYDAELRQNLQIVAKNTPPFRVVTGQLDSFGSQEDILVRKIDNNSELIRLHRQILGVLASRGLVDMTWAGKHYHPHITCQGKNSFLANTTAKIGLNIDEFTVFEKTANRDDWRVVDKLRLKGLQNYIFMDIDGVIWSHHFRDMTPGAKMTDNDKEAMQLIGQLAVEERGKIVVSSSWRHNHQTFNELQESLRLSGATGNFYAHLYDWTPKQPCSRRGLEIQSWLEAHQDSLRNYVILDDLGPHHFLPEQRSHLARTNMITGFTTKEYRQAREILRNTR
jgi:2'-5' RNA ligase